MTKISKSDKVLVLGSCFSTNLGGILKESGYDVMINPFGTIFNPASISNSVSRLISGNHFTIEDCVEMGAGAGKICSFYHHTSFARQTAGEFLQIANDSLDRARDFWNACNKVIITYGTAQVWKHYGSIVSNCLKRPGYEFTHEMLSVEEVARYTRNMIVDGKEYIFTVSPIRHMGEGVHVNTISKSTLHLGLQSGMNDRCEYFPAYEIMLDELRDYRWYAEDLVHPTKDAISEIYSRFLVCLDAADSVD